MNISLHLGGTGKTYLMNLILASIRSNGDIALAVASSGIAATLLTGGRTAHSTFRLPLNLAVNDTPVCNVGKSSKEAGLLRQTKIVLIDEVSMLHKRGVEAINRLLQDLKDNDRLFGGITFVLAGDFRQCLPVIAGGNSADQLNACLKSSFLWKHVKVLK